MFNVGSRLAVPSIYSIVPPNDGSAVRHGHPFEPMDFKIVYGRGHHNACSAGSCQRTYARACGCRQRPRRHREKLIEAEWGWSRAAVGRERHPAGRLGVSVDHHRNGPYPEPGATLQADRRGRGCEVLVPRSSQRLHHRRRARSDVAERPDQAAGQPRPAQRCHGRLRRRLDHRAITQSRAENRRPYRGVDDERPRTRGGDVIALPPTRRPHQARTPAANRGLRMIGLSLSPSASAVKTLVAAAGIESEILYRGCWRAAPVSPHGRSRSEAPASCVLGSTNW